MDETAIASELPHVRALASGGEAPRDRIFVRDYTRSVEIGAFSTERGVTQRIRFNVVIEVSHTAAAEVDDVDKVLSYDSLTEAIETELARERINLLETLAERVARRCLSDPRAVCAFVRVEKLDRIPGALGVEIVRTRSDDVPRVPPATVLPEAASRPLVLFLPNRVLLGAEGGRWRDAAAGPPRAAILALEPVSPQPPAAGPAALRAGLLAVEQNAWTLAAVDGRFVVAASRTEIDWALGAGQPTVWAPTKLVADAVSRERLDASAPLGLARWLAAELGAEHVLAVGTGENSPSLTVLDPGAPERLGDFV